MIHPNTCSVFSGEENATPKDYRRSPRLETKGDSSLGGGGQNEQDQTGQISQRRGKKKEKNAQQGRELT